MSRYVIAYDLGTGGNKSSLYDVNGRCVAENFQSYPTSYPHQIGVVGRSSRPRWSIGTAPRLCPEMPRAAISPGGMAASAIKCRVPATIAAHQSSGRCSCQFWWG